MVTINKISKLLSETKEMQILQLVSESANDISMGVFDKNSEMFPYLEMRELIRTRIYLSRLGDVEPSATYLVTTSNAYDKTIGYILYHKVIGRPFDISIISTIVSSEFRNQGIFKNMMNILKNEFKSITLSCFVEKVPIYQKLDFQIACQIQTQIGMYYGTLNDDGQVISVDDEEIDKIDVVISTLVSVKNKVGQEWAKIYNQYIKDNKDAISIAESFMKNK